MDIQVLMTILHAEQTSNFTLTMPVAYRIIELSNIYTNGWQSIPRIMPSLIIFLVDGSVIMTDWNTNMDIYSGCEFTLLLDDQGFIASISSGSPSENMG